MNLHVLDSSFGHKTDKSSYRTVPFANQDRLLLGFSLYSHVDKLYGQFSMGVRGDDAYLV